MEPHRRHSIGARVDTTSAWPETANVLLVSTLDASCTGTAVTGASAAIFVVVVDASADKLRKDFKSGFTVVSRNKLLWTVFAN